MSDTIICKECQGHGRVPLPLHLQETLDAIRAGKDTAEVLWKKLSTGWGVSGANKRLSVLLQLGLVRRELRSKTWHYTAVIPAARGSKARVRP